VCFLEKEGLRGNGKRRRRWTVERRLLPTDGLGGKAVNWGRFRGAGDIQKRKWKGNWIKDLRGATTRGPFGVRGEHPENRVRKL